MKTYGVVVEVLIAVEAESAEQAETRAIGLVWPLDSTAVEEVTVVYTAERTLA